MRIMKGDIWVFENVLYLQSTLSQCLGQWNEERSISHVSFSSLLFSPGKARELSTSWAWLHANSVLDFSPGRQTPFHVISHGLTFPSNIPSVGLISSWNTCSINWLGNIPLSQCHISSLLPHLFLVMVLSVVDVFFSIDVLHYQQMWVKSSGHVSVPSLLWWGPGLPFGALSPLFTPQSLLVSVNLIKPWYLCVTWPQSPSLQSVQGDIYHQSMVQLLHGEMPRMQVVICSQGEHFFAWARKGNWLPGQEVPCPHSHCLWSLSHGKDSSCCQERGSQPASTEFVHNVRCS